MIVNESDGAEKRTRRCQTRPVLPPAAIELGRQIANDAPPVSDAKLARLRLLLHGTPVLSPAMRKFVDETVAKAPPMSDEMRDDLRLIMWAGQADEPADGGGNTTTSPG